MNIYIYICIYIYIAYCLFSIAYCLLPIAHILLPSVYCLSSIVYLLCKEDKQMRSPFFPAAHSVMEALAKEVASKAKDLTNRIHHKCIQTGIFEKMPMCNFTACWSIYYIELDSDRFCATECICFLCGLLLLLITITFSANMCVGYGRSDV